MPTRNVVLREAARIGLADIDAGRFDTFTDVDSFGRHLTALTDKVISDEAILGEAIPGPGPNG